MTPHDLTELIQLVYEMMYERHYRLSGGKRWTFGHGGAFHNCLNHQCQLAARLHHQHLCDDMAAERAALKAHE